MAEMVKTWANLFLGFVIAVILVSFSSCNNVLAQSEDKDLTAPNFGLSMKYPSDWTFVPQEEKFSPGTYGGDTFGGYATLGNLCLTSETESTPNIDCRTTPTLSAKFQISAYNLRNGTTMKEFYEKQIEQLEAVSESVGHREYLNTSRVDISGLSAIQTISSLSGTGGAFGKLLQLTGETSPTSKWVDVYVVNGSTGYHFYGVVDDIKDADTYFPTFQKMIESIQIKGAKENPQNTSFQPANKNTPTDEVILVSQKLKKGTGTYNHIVGQVKNVANDIVKQVKIGLTVYDGNGDVIGTDSAYAESTTLQPNQKSTFDIISSKDNFEGMKNYELSLYWQDYVGNDQYVENAQVFKDQK